MNELEQQLIDGTIKAPADALGRSEVAGAAPAPSESHGDGSGLRHQPILELRGITKQFPGVLANDHVDFDLVRGEVHALLGENGAGKSTLMNIVYGLYRPDEGEILLKGKRVRFSSSKDAIRSGIGMVHQHFMLIPVMTVAENIMLAEEPDARRRAARLRRRREAGQGPRRLRSTSRSTRTPGSRTSSVGQQQRVEILKALYRKADILILDEPTAVLTPQEARRAVRDPAHA